MSLFFGVAGALGNLYGQYRGGRETERARKNYGKEMDSILAGQQRDIDTHLQPEMYKDFMQTQQSQSVLRTVQDQLRENAQRIRGGVAKSGGTTEAAVAGQTASNRGYGDIVNRLSAQGTAYQQAARDRYMNALQNLYGQKTRRQEVRLGMGQQMGQYWSQAGRQFQDAMQTIGDLGLTEEQKEQGAKLILGGGV